MFFNFAYLRTLDNSLKLRCRFKDKINYDDVFCKYILIFQV